MRLVPRSLFGRLLATAAAALVVALTVAGFGIAQVLERFVTHGLDERLDAQIAVVARVVRPDGTLDRSRAIDVPPFDEPGSGWAWELRVPGGTLRSASLGAADIMVDAERPPPPERHWHDTGRPRPFDGVDAAGQPVHGRSLLLPGPAGDILLLATGPRSVVERPLRWALLPLLSSLLLLGLALALAILVQLRFGLRPLGALQAMVGEVRAGRRRQLDATEPTELLPLIGELNALIAANEAALAQARGHAANLAHGLKTPLAALRLDLAEPGRDPDGRFAAQIERIDRQIRHHLGRARADSPAGAPRLTTPLAPHVRDIVQALEHIHAERQIRIAVEIADAIAVRCDPQDLDEMLGNLLDNGWRWAASAIRLTAERRAAMIVIIVTDDGPGLPATALQRAMEPGTRLDERGDGHGFGLSITRELAELHGGHLRLANAIAGWADRRADAAGGVIRRLQSPDHRSG